MAVVSDVELVGIVVATEVMGWVLAPTLRSQALLGAEAGEQLVVMSRDM